MTRSGKIGLEDWIDRISGSGRGSGKRFVDADVVQVHQFALEIVLARVARRVLCFPRLKYL